MRRFAPLLLALFLAGCSTPEEDPTPPASPAATSPAATSPAAASPAPDFAGLEAEFDARLGVFAVDTGTGETVSYRADERFAYASTYKALAAAAVLDSGVEFDHEVARRAITISDNEAGNVLFDLLGGPEGFEATLRTLGDGVTESERREPDLNEFSPGDVRDTSSPRAFGGVLEQYAVGDALDAADRELFLQWLRDNTTGDEQIRAGVPAEWVVGDKTGHAGVYGNQNDMAVVWPADGAEPWVVVVFSDRSEPDDESDVALVARAAGLVVDQLS